MKNKSINQVSIINGEDGPTSVFIFGEAQKQSLKIRIRNAIYQSRRKRIEKRIAANPHTLAAVVAYPLNHNDPLRIAPLPQGYAGWPLFSFLSFFVWIDR